MRSKAVQTSDNAASQGIATRGSRTLLRRLLTPSFSDILFGAVLVWFAATGWQSLLGDGDTGYHIRTGDYVLATGKIPTTDLFSFSKPDQAWFAWEWLSGVMFSLLHSNWQLKGVVFFSGALISLSVAALFRFMLYRGSELLPAIVLVLLANAAASLHYLARPHVVSFLFLLSAMYLIESDRRKPGRRLWLVVPLACLWANMHGGFAALFAIIGLLGIGSMLEGLVASGFDWRRVLHPGDGPGADRFHYFHRLTALGCASLFATLANPFGYHLHVHIVKYLTDGWMKNYVQELHSPDFRGEQILLYEILLLLGLLLSSVLIQQRRYGEALLIVFWAHQSLMSVRHVTMYAWIATPIIGAELSRLWRSLSSEFSSKSTMGVLRDLSRDFSRLPMHTSVWGALLLVFLWISPGRSWPKDFSEDKFPVKIVESYAAKLNPREGRRPRILASDQFGDYLIYRFYPDVRVFIDGRSDFYGPDLGGQYMKMLGLDWQWRELMDRWNFDYVLIPHDWRLGERLKDDPGWKVLEDSAVGILLERRRPY